MPRLHGFLQLSGAPPASHGTICYVQILSLKLTCMNDTDTGIIILGHYFISGLNGICIIEPRPVIGCANTLTTCIVMSLPLVRIIVATRLYTIVTTTGTIRSRNKLCPWLLMPHVKCSYIG